MSFQLSPDQENAIGGILDQFNKAAMNSHSAAVLTGSAGTGKTTVIEYLAKELKRNDFSIVFTATTHKAAEVLQDTIGQETSTAHKMFQLKPTVSKYGNEILKSTGMVKIPAGTVVVVDEASMIGNAFLKAIVDIVKKKFLKILFVGDPFQLPPTKDKCTLFDGSLPTFKLTTVHRQALNNPILAKAIEYREYIAGNRSEPVLETALDKAGNGIHVLEHSNFVSNFVKKYLDYDTGGIVDIPLCTYTNDSAINYNNMIRKAAYFLEDTIAPFYPGELLVSNSHVTNGMKTVLSNNEQVIVKSFEPSEFMGCKGYEVTVTGNYNVFDKTDVKHVFVPLNHEVKQQLLKEQKEIAIAGGSRADWVYYYDIVNAIADLRPPFAGTTHKAQGGTFPAVFIDRVNINKCKNPMVRARLMYVALTRARYNVYINS